MMKKIKFALAAAWILLSRSFDAYATYRHTPDLENEANPLVSVLGMGWLPLLLVVGAFTLYAIYAFYTATFKPFGLMPREKGLGFGDFSAYLYLGTKAPWTSMFYRLPNSLRRFNHYMGHLLPKCLVYAGIVSTTMWLLINHTDFYPPLHRAGAVYAILSGGIAAIILRWHKSMYAKYLSA